jgi:hypothetical protein
MSSVDLPPSRCPPPPAHLCRQIEPPQDVVCFRYPLLLVSIGQGSQRSLRLPRLASRHSSVLPSSAPTASQKRHWLTCKTHGTSCWSPSSDPSQASPSPLAAFFSAASAVSPVQDRRQTRWLHVGRPRWHVCRALQGRLPRLALASRPVGNPPSPPFSDGLLLARLASDCSPRFTPSSTSPARRLACAFDRLARISRPLLENTRHSLPSRTTSHQPSSSSRSTSTSQASLISRLHPPQQPCPRASTAPSSRRVACPAGCRYLHSHFMTPPLGPAPPPAPADIAFQPTPNAMTFPFTCWLTVLSAGRPRLRRAPRRERGHVTGDSTVRPHAGWRISPRLQHASNLPSSPTAVSAAA